MAMMLNFPGARGVSSQGRSPITPAGRVVYNVIVDDDEARVRDQRLDSNRAAIQVSTVPAVWYCQKGNPAVRNRRKRPRQANQLTSTDLNVVDAANGLGSRGQSKAQLNLEIETFGVIGENKLYDGAKAATVQMGGLQTIRNSGPYDITPGVWVVVEAPDPNNPKVANFTDLPKEKILFQTVPYDPERVAPSIELLRLMLVDGKATETQRDDLRKNQAYADNFAKAFSVGMRAIGYAGVIAALQAGVVQMGSPDVAQQGQAAANFNGKAGENFRVQLGKAFDLAKRSAEERSSWLAEDPTSDTKEQISVGQYLTRTLLMGRDFAPIFASTKSASTDQRVYDDSNRQGITEAVNDAVADMLVAFRQMDYEEKRRIIGRAMSAAAPGQDFDIYLGNYVA